MLPAGAAAEIGACHHNSALGEMGGDVLGDSRQAVTADLPGVGELQEAAGINHVRVDVIAHNQGFSRDFCFHGHASIPSR